MDPFPRVREKGKVAGKKKSGLFQDNQRIDVPKPEVFEHLGMSLY